MGTLTSYNSEKNIQRFIFCFKRQNLWELLQIAILQINSKIIGTITLPNLLAFRVCLKNLKKSYLNLQLNVVVPTETFFSTPFIVFDNFFCSSSYVFRLLGEFSNLVLLLNLCMSSHISKRFE